MKTAVIVITLPEGNLGDILIHKALLNALRSRIRLIVDDKHISKLTFDRLGLQEQDRASFYGYRRGFLWQEGKILPKKCDYLILGPGHFFTTGKGLFSNEWRKRSRWILKRIWSLFYFAVIRFLGIKVCRFGVSIGPMVGIDNFFEKLQAGLMHVYSVRDSGSKKYVESIAVKNAVIFPDCAFLRPMVTSLDTQLKDYVVVSFREKIFKDHPDDQYADDILTAVERIAKHILSKPSRAIMITSQVDEDMVFSEKIFERIKGLGNVSLRKDLIVEADINKVYGNAAMVISNRLHVLLFAMSCSALPVAVTYKNKHSKLTGILQDMGLGESILDIGEEYQVDQFLSEYEGNADGHKRKVAAAWLVQNTRANALLDRCFAKGI